MVSRRTIASAALWRTMEIGLSEVASFVVFLIIARLVMPEAFGVVALASITVAFGVPLLSQGIAEAIVQRRRASRSYLDTAFWLNAALGLALAAALVLLAPALALLFGEPSLEPVLVALAPIFLLTSMSAVLQAKLRREMRFRAFALRALLAVMAGGAVGIGLALEGYGAWALVGQQLAHNLVGLGVLAAASDWRPRLRVRPRHAGEILRFGRFTTAASFTEFAIGRLDVLIVGLFLPAAGVALYYFAKRIVFAVGLFTYYSIQQVGLPVLVRRIEAAGGPEAAGPTVLRLLTVSALLCGACLVGLAFIAQPFIALTAGERWLGAALPLAILAMGAIPFGLRVAAGQALVAAGRPALHARQAGLNAVLALSGAALGASQGVLGAAIGVALAHGLCLPLALQALATTFGLARPALATTLARALAPAFIMAAGLTVLATTTAPASAEPAGVAQTVAAGAALFLLSAGLLYRRTLMPALAPLLSRWPRLPSLPIHRAAAPPAVKGH